jgi:hypothetical protein
MNRPVRNPSTAALKGGSAPSPRISPATTNIPAPKTRSALMRSRIARNFAGMGGSLLFGMTQLRIIGSVLTTNYIAFSQAFIH